MPTTKADVELRDQFSELGRQIATELVENVLGTAQAIESDIRSRRWSSKVPVRLDAKDPTLIIVRVGSARRFYAGFLEFGTVATPARPIVTPAAEQQRAKFMARVKALESKLHGL